MKLKKAITVDKLKPLIEGKTSVSTSAAPTSGGHVSSQSGSSPMPAGGPPQLGNLFAGGMPKLKSVKDNRLGLVPASAPQIPLPPSMTPPAPQTTAPKAPLAPSSRPTERNSIPAPHAPAVPSLGPPPPPLPSSVPPLPSTRPSVPLAAPPVPHQLLKVPKMPSSRPRKQEHAQTGSVSSMGSFESADLSHVPKPPLSLPPAPPPIPTSVPPSIPTNGPPRPPLPGNTSAAKSSGSTPPAPPAPGALPFLAQINAKRDDANVVDHVESSGAAGAPKQTPPAPLRAPPLPTSAPPIPTAPPPPLSAPAPPAPPVPGLSTPQPKAGSGPPPPPPAGLFGGNGSSKQAPSTPASGGLPFIDQINAKRSETFVVDGSSSGYSTTQESTPTPVQKRPQAPISVPPVPSPAPPAEASVVPAPSAGLPFLSQINARRTEPSSKSRGAAPLAPPLAVPTAPPIPAAAPPQRKTLAAPSAPSAPPASGLPFLDQINANRSDSGVSGAPPPPLVPPQVSAPPPVPPLVPTQSPSAPAPVPSVPSSLPPSAPPSVPPSAPAVSGHRKTAPPPPPSSLDQQQTAGLSLRKISALAYTINTHQRNGTDSKPQKIVIDDLRFRFVNQDALPHPRRFEGKQKLYPSGRGLSVPLDLTLF